MGVFEHFDEWLTAQEPRERRSHWPSDIGACRRALWYKWHNTPESNPITAGGRLKMKYGNESENIYEKYLLWLLGEGRIIAFTPDYRNKHQHPDLAYPISYELDFLVVDAEDRKVITELKSSYGRWIANLTKPATDALQQIGLYHHFENLLDGEIVYLARDNGYRCSWDTLYEGGVLGYKRPWEREWISAGFSIEDEIQKLVVLEQLLESKDEPARDYYIAIKNGEYRDKFQYLKVEYKTHWRCSYCRHRNLCWAEVIAQYGIFPNNVDMIVDWRENNPGWENE